MEDVAVDPPELILSFVENLPRALKPDVLLFVVLYATEVTDRPDQDTFIQILRELLTTGSPYTKFGATLRVIAALDYVLGRHGRKLDAALKRIQEADLDQSQLRIKSQFMAGQALRQRHSNSTIKAWRNLRANALSHNSLMVFEDKLQGPTTPSAEGM